MVLSKDPPRNYLDIVRMFEWFFHHNNMYNRKNYHT